MGALVMFLMAAIFFFVYFRWKENWWALIPAGIFASIGVEALLGMLVPINQPFFEGLLTGILLLGFGLTFGALWFQHACLPTAWARFPAIGLIVAAVLAFFIGGNSNATTGDFSFGIMGHYVENGEVKHAINEMNVSGNFKDFWKQLVELGSDPFPYGSWQIPSLHFKDVQFSGL